MEMPGTITIMAKLIITHIKVFAEPYTIFLASGQIVPKQLL